MRLLSFGNRTTGLVVDPHVAAALSGFLRRATYEAAPGTADVDLHVGTGGRISLVLSVENRQAGLTLPAERVRATSRHVLAIGVLQAAARCLALCIRGQGSALLHGGAVTIGPTGAAVAVVDGGRGQGKTSLAVGLGRPEGSLLVDEFTFVDTTSRIPVVHPAPHLPWHVRADMRPHLAPGDHRGELLFPDDLPAQAAAGASLPLGAVLVPDMSRQPGTYERVRADVARRLLYSAVTDHRAKLLDPRLDHVSLFSAASEITEADGTPLAKTYGPFDHHGRLVLEAIAQCPTFVVGIGRPEQLPQSVSAARRALEDL